MVKNERIGKRLLRNTFKSISVATAAQPSRAYQIPNSIIKEALKKDKKKKKTTYHNSVWSC